MIDRSLDAINAFLLTTLSEGEHFLIRLPPGLELLGLKIDDDDIAELLKPLYGLHLAPKKWLEQIEKESRSLGYEQIPEEPCLWIHRQKEMATFACSWLPLSGGAQYLCYMWRSSYIQQFPFRVCNFIALIHIVITGSNYSQDDSNLPAHLPFVHYDTISALYLVLRQRSPRSWLL